MGTLTTASQQVLDVADHRISGVLAVLDLASGQRPMWQGLRRREPSGQAEGVVGTITAVGSHVFISYSQKDAEYVGRLEIHLASSGLEVWTDRGIPAGAQWARTIDAQVRACAVLIPVMSHHSRESVWVTEEILLAQRLHKPIMPLLLAGEPFIGLLGTQYEDVTDGGVPADQYVDRLRELTIVDSTEQVPASAPAHQRLHAPVVAWGGNEHGQTSVPAGLTEVVGIATGGYHSLALHRNGRVTAWGRDTFHESTVPDRLTGATAIAAGLDFSLAVHRDLDGSRVTAWGRHHIDPHTFDVRPLLWGSFHNVVAIAAGDDYSLVLCRSANDSTYLEAWRLSGGVFYSLSVPVGLSGIVAIAVGGRDLNLALHEDGRVTAWRQDRRGDVSGGPSSHKAYDMLALPEGLTDIAAISAGITHSLALHSDGHVTAWDHGARVVSGPVLSDVIAIAAGGGHSLALHRDGHVTAWGQDKHGQATVPVGLIDVTAIAAGRTHSLALVRQ